MVADQMPAIVRGQSISKAKFIRSKELRQQMTKEERILWGFLRRNGLYGLHFRRQQVIDGYIVDFYCHAANLVLEIDGAVHDYQTEKDKERDRILMDKGLKVIRIKNEEIRNDIHNVLVKIASACGCKLIE